MSFIISFFLLISTSLWAVPEAELSHLWNKEILPYFHELNHEFMTNSKGLKVSHYYKTHHENSKALVILPGRTEGSIKYAELIYDLRFKGFDIFIIDHQGQGFSDRLLKDSHKGHVMRFDNYVDDLSQWINNVVIKEAQGKPLFLLAHSMGGAIATRYMARYPETFSKAVLSSPMLQINTSPYSEKVAKLFARLLITLQKATNYTPGWGPYDPENYTFESNNGTHSEVRFNQIKDLYSDNPELILWAPTVRWTYEALKATRKIDETAPKIKTPILLFQAGKDETVRAGRQNSFCQKASSCELSYFPESFHEPLMERDDIRNRALLELIHFLQ